MYLHIACCSQGQRDKEPESSACLQQHVMIVITAFGGTSGIQHPSLLGAKKTVLALFGPRAASPRREITKGARTQRPTGREAAAWHGWYVQGNEITYGSRVTSCRIPGREVGQLCTPRQGACKRILCVISHRPSWVPGNMEQTDLEGGSLRGGRTWYLKGTYIQVRYAPTEVPRQEGRSQCVLATDGFVYHVGCIPTNASK